MVEFSMAHLSGTDRSQLFLLPEAVDDYVGLNNPVLFIEALVDGLDLAAAAFVRAAAKETGRPGYDPADLLKLYVYGHINRVRSSRRLEAEAHRNIEVMWLLRHLKPDFRTIADFRRVSRSAFKQVFREFVIVCRQLDLVEAAMDTLGVDRIEAVADRGYFKIEDIEACEKAGITTYVPRPIRGPAVAEGFFSKEQFHYDPDRDIYLCPADQVLSPRHFGKSSGVRSRPGWSSRFRAADSRCGGPCRRPRDAPPQHAGNAGRPDGRRPAAPARSRPSRRPTAPSPHRRC